MSRAYYTGAEAASLVTAVYRTRKQTYADRMAEKGLVQFSAWVPKSTLADFTIAADDCRKDRDLRLAQLKNVKTGRFQGVGKSIWRASSKVENTPVSGVSKKGEAI